MYKYTYKLSNKIIKKNEKNFNQQKRKYKKKDKF